MTPTKTEAINFGNKKNVGNKKEKSKQKTTTKTKSKSSEDSIEVSSSPCFAGSKSKDINPDYF